MTTWTRPAPLAHPPPEDVLPPRPDSPGAESSASQQDDSDLGHINVDAARQQTEMQQLGAAAGADANGAAKWGLLGSTVDQVHFSADQTTRYFHICQ